MDIYFQYEFSLRSLCGVSFHVHLLRVPCVLFLLVPSSLLCYLSFLSPTDILLGFLLVISNLVAEVFGLFVWLVGCLCVCVCVS